MAAKIRPVGLKDAVGYRRCFDVLAKENQYGFEGGAMPMPKVRAQVRDALRRKMPFLVAVEESVLSDGPPYMALTCPPVDIA